MADQLLDALIALKAQFDTTPAMDAEIVGRLLVVHIDTRQAFGDGDWGVSWGSKTMTSEHGRWFEHCPDGMTAGVDTDTVKRILEAAPEGDPQPPCLLGDLPADPATARMLPFAMGLGYLTSSGLTVVLPVRLVWDFQTA